MSTVKWSVIEEEIRDLLNSDVFESGNKYHKYLLRWGNRTQREIAQKINIREHFDTDGADISLTTTDYFVSLPSDFFKISDRFTTVRLDEDYLQIVPLETLASYDPDHDKTTTNTKPDYVAIEGNRLYQFPMATWTAVIENYFRTPTDMTSGTSPDLTDDNVLVDLLVSGVLRRGFAIKQDFDMVKFYTSEYARYLDEYMAHVDTNNSRQIVKHTNF